MSGRHLEGTESRLAWLLVAPALGVVAVLGIVPLAMTAWEALHLHDLRMPWRGRPFIGLAHLTTAIGDERLQQALWHTGAFTAATVAIELVVGLALALLLDAVTRGRGAARVVVLLPWALPTVVVGLLARFIFDGQSGLAGPVAPLVGFRDWLSDPVGAWIPIAAADVWKSTPFMALLLLAGLQAIDPALNEAARMDGASAWRRFWSITLPLLMPSVLVAALFRTLDAMRVFDLVFVLTGGGPGTSTEVVSLYAFTTLLQDLRFGYGSALSMILFLVTFVLALGYVRVVTRGTATGAGA